MCFSKGGILWRFVIKICLIKRSTEVIRTQWQHFLQDPRSDIWQIHWYVLLIKLTWLWTTGPCWPSQCDSFITVLLCTYVWYGNYSRLLISRLRLSRITAYLEVKIWSLFKHENLKTSKKTKKKKKKKKKKQEEKLLLKYMYPGSLLKYQAP